MRRLGLLVVGVAALLGAGCGSSSAGGFKDLKHRDGGTEASSGTTSGSGGSAGSGVDGDGGSAGASANAAAGGAGTSTADGGGTGPAVGPSTCHRYGDVYKT